MDVLYYSFEDDEIIFIKVDSGNTSHEATTINYQNHHEAASTACGGGGGGGGGGS